MQRLVQRRACLGTVSHSSSKRSPAAQSITAAPNLSETHLLGREDELWPIRASGQDPRPFIARAPICAALGRYQIAHAGVHHATFPFRVVRTHQSGTYFLACFDGEGRVLADGRWQRVTAGMACLLLPHMLNAFHAVENKPWRFAWVRFQEPPQQQPIISAASPRLARYNPEPLRHALLGLHSECGQAQSPAVIHHWVELIHEYVIQFARPWRTDDRLARVWEQVAAQLAADWDVERLAHTAHLSPEHLRRLCHRELGRSPMHHVTFLRMKRAAQLLAETRLKVEHIAAEVGYADPFVFSKAFKKWTGWRPSDFPGRHARGLQ